MQSQIKSIALPVLAILSLAGCGSPTSNASGKAERDPEDYKSWLIARTEVGVKARLRDPDTAEFSDVHTTTYQGAEVVCGTVFFDGGGANPITDSLPDCVLIKLSETRGIEQLLDLMMEEAFNSGDGQQASLDRLCEILIIRLLRHCIAHGIASSGTLAGLADIRIAKVMQAIHDQPSRAWTLEDMAQTAGMSRARFAAHFKTQTGTTPANYLASWRLMLAQKLMKKGLALKRIAVEVGYGSSSALARAFARAFDCSPLQWLQAHSASLTPDLG